MSDLESLFQSSAEVRARLNTLSDSASVSSCSPYVIADACDRAHELIVTLEAQLAESQARERWVSVGERLPPENPNEEYLVAIGGGSAGFDVAYWLGDCWETNLTGREEAHAFTHWREIQPPREGG